MPSSIQPNQDAQKPSICWRFSFVFTGFPPSGQWPVRLAGYTDLNAACDPPSQTRRAGYGDGMRSGWMLLATPALLGVLANSVWAAGQDWPLYGGEGGRRFSDLAQITRANVAGLQQAWRFDMIEAGD